MNRIKLTDRVFLEKNNIENDLKEKLNKFFKGGEKVGGEGIE